MTHTNLTAIALAAALLAGASLTSAAEKPAENAAESAPATAVSPPRVVKQTFDVKMRDLQDNVLPIAQDEQVWIVVYTMVGQQRSHQALAHVQQIVADMKGVRAVAVVSGTNALTRARRLPELAQWTGPVVADAEYQVSDAGDVRAWPTTLVVAPSGKRVAHIAGLTAMFTKDLTAYVDFAAGRLDDAGLKQRLESHDIVATRPQYMSDRYLAVAGRLIDQGEYAEARQQLEEARRLQPADARVKLALARVLVMQNEPAKALQQLEDVDTSALAAWQVHAVRGRALAALGEWERARPELIEGVRLNPAPAECYYDLGRAYQQAGEPQKAAEAFRAAYEHAVGVTRVPVPMPAAAPADPKPAPVPFPKD